MKSTCGEEEATWMPKINAVLLWNRKMKIEQEIISMICFKITVCSLAFWIVPQLRSNTLFQSSLQSFILFFMDILHFGLAKQHFAFALICMSPC